MMLRLDEGIIRSTLGSRDDAIGYHWKTLWLKSDTEKADEELKKASSGRPRNRERPRTARRRATRVHGAIGYDAQLLLSESGKLLHLYRDVAGCAEVMKKLTSPEAR